MVSSSGKVVRAGVHCCPGVTFRCPKGVAGLDSTPVSTALLLEPVNAGGGPFWQSVSFNNLEQRVTAVTINNQPLYRGSDNRCAQL